jgi:hypothetical protein
LCLGVTHCTIKYALLRLKAYGAVLGVTLLTPLT